MNRSWRLHAVHRTPLFSVYRSKSILLVDVALLAGITVLCVAAWQSLDANPRFSWDWATLSEYLVRSSPAPHPGLLLQGLFTTLRLTLVSTLLAMVLGTLAGTAKSSSSLYLRLVSGTYVELCRNLPPLILVFLCHFFLAEQLTPIIDLLEWLRRAPLVVQNISEVLLGPLDQADAFLTAVITLGIYEGAYVAEIVRGGISAVPQGQWEAGQALGFPRWKLLANIIYPQAFRTMIPPLTGQMISTIKDSAIVSVISIQELTFQGAQLVATTYRTFEIWLSVAGLYFVLTYSCSLVAAWTEKTLRKQAY